MGVQGLIDVDDIHLKEAVVKYIVIIISKLISEPNVKPIHNQISHCVHCNHSPCFSGLGLFQAKSLAGLDLLPP